MSTIASNIEFVKRMYEIFSSGDLDAMISQFHEDAIWEYPEIPGVSFGGIRHGHAGIHQFYQEMLAQEQPLELVQHEYLCNGDTVAVFGRYKALVHATRRTWEVEYVHRFVLCEGKVSHLQMFFNGSPEMLAQARD